MDERSVTAGKPEKVAPGLAQALLRNHPAALRAAP
jgi:hypothetical protein